jgi:3-oxoacyl-[acyl-carrier protein] reductase
MKLGIEGRVALVTGASKGIGKSIALSLADEGVNLCLLSRNEENLNLVKNEIENNTGIIPMIIKGDVSDVNLANKSLNTVKEKYGQIDILVNNCEGPPMGNFLEHDIDAWRKAYERNLYSVINFTSEVAPLMKEKKWGRIINITSILAKEPTPAMVLSATMRAGVSAFTKSISTELAEFNITVNTVCPSAVLTDRMISLTNVSAERQGKSYQEIIDSAVASIPAKRFSTPEEIGDYVAFLASERAAYITGISHIIDGGYSKSIF